jgi:hypothetical protein
MAGLLIVLMSVWIVRHLSIHFFFPKISAWFYSLKGEEFIRAKFSEVQEQYNEIRKKQDLNRAEMADLNRKTILCTNNDVEVYVDLKFCRERENKLSKEWYLAYCRREIYENACINKIAKRKRIKAS